MIPKVAPETWRRVFDAVRYMALGAFIVLMGGLLFTLTQVLSSVQKLAGDTDDTVTEIRQTQKGSRSLLEFLKDCTEPEGRCFQEAQARAAEQAGALNAAVIAAQYCSDQVLGDAYTLRELTACVGQILDGKGHQ